MMVGLPTKDIELVLLEAQGSETFGIRTLLDTAHHLVAAIKHASARNDLERVEKYSEWLRKCMTNAGREIALYEACMGVLEYDEQHLNSAMYSRLDTMKSRLTMVHAKTVAQAQMNKYPSDEYEFKYTEYSALLDQAGSDDASNETRPDESLDGSNATSKRSKPNVQGEYETREVLNSSLVPDNLAPLMIYLNKRELEMEEEESSTKKRLRRLSSDGCAGSGCKDRTTRRSPRPGNKLHSAKGIFLSLLLAVGSCSVRAAVLPVPGVLTLIGMSMASDHNLRKSGPERKLYSHLSDEESELLSSESIAESVLEAHLSDEDESPGRDLQMQPRHNEPKQDENAILPFPPLLPEEFEARLSEEETLKRRELNQAVWYPKWANTFNNGYCCHGGLPLHGIPTYSDKSTCCNSWFPRQSSNTCMSHNGSCSGAPPATPSTGSPTGTPPGPNTPPATPSTGSPTGTPPGPNTPSPSNPTTVVSPALPIPPRPGCKSDNSWVMPDDYLWKDTPFAGKTCSDLESFVPSDDLEQVWEFCEFLSQGIYSSPTVMDACCFCGGGDNSDKSPSCKDMEWNSLEFNLGCKFIERLPKANQDAFCNAFGKTSFSDDGLTMKDACCVCGGGNQDYTCTTKPPSDGENGTPGTSPSPGGGVPVSTGVLGVPDVIDINFRDIKFISGVPNLEYLGLGYDLLVGNPRGSSNSELDPGFRYRIVRLVQSQKNYTVDAAFTVPFGVDVKYTSSCKYDDSSVEVTSESDMKKSLQKETKLEESTSFKASLGIDKILSAFSLSFETKHSFSRSENFQSSIDTNNKEKRTSFEARAVCSEFEASFVPGYDHEVTPEFKKMRDNLPKPFDKTNIRHVKEWSSFFDAFGAFYVKHVVLGGKRIYSTSMSQQDYSSLVSQSVDVESTLTFEMSAGIKASKGVKVGMAKAAGELAAKKYGEKGEAVSSVISVVTGGKEDSDTLVGVDADVSGEKALSEFASNKRQAENALKISNMELTTTEYTFGGLPSEDWRAWSTTVREKPMPIQYTLGTIFEFLSYEQKHAFIEAYKYIYNIDLTPKTEDPFLKGTTHHGVYNGKGDPLSMHTLNPNDDSRVLLKLSDSDPKNEDLPLYDPPDRTKCGAAKEIKISSFQINHDKNEAGTAEWKLSLDGTTYFPRKNSDCEQTEKEGFCDWKSRNALHEIEAQADWRRFESKTIVFEAFEDDSTCPLWTNCHDITRASVPANLWYIPDFCEPYEIKVAQKRETNKESYYRSVCWGVTLKNTYEKPESPASWCETWNAPDEYEVFSLKIRPWAGTTSGNCRDSNKNQYSRIGKEFKDVTALEPETCFLYCSDLPDAHHQTGVTVRNSETNFCFCEYDFQKLPLKSSLEADGGSIIWQGSGSGTADKSNADRSVGNECYPNKNYVGRSPFVKYADVFKGKTNQPAAIFATPIRGKVAVDFNESNDNTMFDGDKKGANFMMSFTKHINYNAKLAIASFGGGFDETDEESVDTCPLPSFSYITTQTLERYGADFRSGIVLHDGILADPISRDNFYVTSMDESTTVQFVNQTYESPPTVIVFPNWYTCDDKEFPIEVQDVSFFLHAITVDEFVIFQTKRDTTTLTSSNLGFNFLVIGPNMTAPEVEHGFESTPESNKEITFSTPFADIPSVVVTPFFHGMDTTNIPRCIVESITKTAAEVKCLWAPSGDNSMTFSGIAFTWIAVGHK